MKTMRSLIQASWLRSEAAGVDVDGNAAQPWLEHGDVLDYRSGHMLAPVFPLLYDVLGRAAEDCDCVMAVGDSHSRLLWVTGRPSVKRQAERIAFMEGTDWAEAHVGTNAPGLAVRLDEAVHIVSREHFSSAYKDWSCAAAPIHHPETQQIIGVVDVTGTGIIDTPATLAMVRAAARMAESELGRLLVVGRTHGSGSAGESRPSLDLTGLGRPDLQLQWEGRTERLSRRHSDILTVLASQPEGVSSEHLAVQVYDEDVQPSTMRAQMTRLRGLLGEGFLHSRPYRLEADLTTDWDEVLTALREQRVNDALRLYRGPLLPASDAPGVVEMRDTIERELTQALLRSTSADLLASATRSRWASDSLELWERQTELLPRHSPLWAASLNEVRRLRQEYGLAGQPLPNRMYRL